jgi:hypothetical protein
MTDFFFPPGRRSRSELRAEEENKIVEQVQPEMRVANQVSFHHANRALCE